MRIRHLTTFPCIVRSFSNQTRELTGDSCGKMIDGSCELYEKYGCYNVECKSEGNIDKVLFYDSYGNEIGRESTEPWWLAGNDGDRIKCLDKCPSKLSKVVGYYKGEKCDGDDVHIDCPEPKEPKEPTRSPPSKSSKPSKSSGSKKNKKTSDSKKNKKTSDSKKNKKTSSSSSSKKDESKKYY